MTLRSSIAWTFLAQGLYFVIQYGGSVVLARLLSPKEMGVYAIALSTVGLVAMINQFSLNMYIVREERLTPEKFGTAITINAALNVVLAAAVFLASPLAGQYMHDDGVRRVMAVLALSPLLGLFEFPAGTLAYRDQQFRALAAVQITKALVTTGATLYGAMHGWSYMSLAWGTLLGNLVGCVMITTIARPLRHFRLSLAFWREALHFGSRMMTISTINGIAGRLPDFIMGRLLGLAALGIYGRASGMLSLIWDNLYSSTTRVLVPSLAECNRNGHSLRPLYQRALVMLTGLFWPAFGGLAVLAGPFIHLLYGDQWGEAAPVLSLLCIAHMIGIGLTMTREVFTIKGEINQQARIELLRGICAVALFYLGATQGLLVAAASRIAEIIVIATFYGPALARMTDMRLRNFTSAYLKSAKLLVATVVPPGVLMHLAGWRHDISFGYLMACFASGAGAWLAAVFLTRHPLDQEIIKVLQAVATRFSVQSTSKS